MKSLTVDHTPTMPKTNTITGCNRKFGRKVILNPVSGRRRYSERTTNREKTALARLERLKAYMIAQNWRSARLEAKKLLNGRELDMTCRRIVSAIEDGSQNPEPLLKMKVEFV